MVRNGPTITWSKAAGREDLVHVQADGAPLLELRLEAGRWTVPCDDPLVPALKFHSVGAAVMQIEVDAEWQSVERFGELYARFVPCVVEEETSTVTVVKRAGCVLALVQQSFATGRWEVFDLRGELVAIEAAPGGFRFRDAGLEYVLSNVVDLAARARFDGRGGGESA
jgi:hypothetical protein